MTEAHGRSPLRAFSWRELFVLWWLFFAILAGLGYPTLSRYDPRLCPGVIDSSSYFGLLTRDPGFEGRNSWRVLQPWLGRPIFYLAKSLPFPWEPERFAMLCVTAAIVATSVTVLAQLGLALTHDSAAALLAAFVYATNFWVPNSALAGMVDGGEALCLLLLLAALRAEKYGWLPVVGVVGTLTKETFAVLGPVLAVGYFLGGDRTGGGAKSGSTRWPIGSFVGLVVLALATPGLLRYFYTGEMLWPWQLAADQRSEHPLVERLSSTFLDPGFYYGFVWLLPFAIPRVRVVSKAWWYGALSAATAALVLGIYHDSQGANIARPLFSTLGAPLSLAAGLTLSQFGRRD